MTKKYTITSALFALLLAYMVTGFGLFVLAFIMFKCQLSTNGMELGVTAIYILSTAMGGFFLGRRMEVRRFLWGLLVGLFYVLILLCLSLILNGGTTGLAHHSLGTFLLCLAGGTLGGMLS